jgi:hypothetical protein
MKTIEFITFLIIFIGIVCYSCIRINKVEDELEKKKRNKEALEAENTEFDYGHNVNHKVEE